MENFCSPFKRKNLLCSLQNYVFSRHIPRALPIVRNDTSLILKFAERTGHVRVYYTMVFSWNLNTAKNAWVKGNIIGHCFIWNIFVPTHVVTLTQVGTSVYLGQTHLGTPFQVPAWVRKFSLESTGDEISSLIIIQNLFVQQKFEY